MADRSRREKQSKLEKLAEYKRVRQGGGRARQEQDAQLYDVVTEDQYKSIVKGRLQRDDFVIDDGVGGYTDNGMDDWTGGDDQDGEEEEEEEEEDRRKRRGKKTESVKGKQKAKAPPPPVAPSINAYRPVVSAEAEDDFMASLLSGMGAPPIVPSRKRKPYQHESYRKPSRYEDTSSDGPLDDSHGPLSSDDYISSPNKKVRTDGGTTPATERLARLDVHSNASDDYDTSFDDMDMDAFMEVDDDLLDTKPVSAMQVDSAPLKKKEDPDAVPSWLSVYDSLSVAPDAALGADASTSLAPSDISALEPDGSLRFFWLDYLEHEGRIFFIGKLKDKPTGTWASCCITVENLQRNLFVLPNQDEDTELTDVYNDFDQIRKKAGIKQWKGKFVNRKYAFGELGVPREETKWLKVVYPFEDHQIPMSATSPNIARIFGTNASAFELLVLKRKIMGPCWIQIKNPHVENKGVSWCKLEATVSDPKDFNPFSETDAEAPRDMPPLTVTSLSVRTIVNHKENKREVVCTTARTWHNMQIDDPKPPEQLPCTVQTFVRALDCFPPNFEAQAKANSKGSITPQLNERMLLSSLLMTIYKADPDVIVGHDFLGASLDVLLHRMREFKLNHWSRIGRFRRSRWPPIGKQGTNLKFMSGRMLCDLASDGAKTMISSTTWSLTEMCKTHLKNDRQDIDPDDTASYMDGSVGSPDRLLTFVRHCELDAHYHMAIAAKVQILPLTKQLTNLAGNSWNKTLNGGRAERNEYILLHEFHRLKYICPDKTWGKKSAVVKQEPQEYGDDGEPKKASKAKPKRDKYKGGLVFEPKRGLFDKYILVMDFNSLYPSIIQEYNIDFTTIEPVEELEEAAEERIPDPPSSDVAQGVLPRLIATLVNRRRQVKSLMKDKSVSHAKLLQYDIKQQALKLTANSMYGCLGFEYSRFYARPLAALTTFKGREILTHTRELAESLQLEVVYGDTDSVFVNSNVTELPEALKISAEFKKAVNDRYRLLEIDLDSVFQRLLLLQKKKYAALKVEDGTRTSIEVKGLDMKRREYCALSKTISQYVLDQILSGEATENVVHNIHEYLTMIGENVREGKVKLDEFIIFKRLGKNLEDYPDAKTQPHVQVGLRMKARGGNARVGDVIPYIFCLAEGEEPAKTAQADRAKHPDEIRKPGSGLKIDFEHYLGNQVLPPIERLCEPIEGTDRARLAECLGLDPGRYRNSVAGAAEVSFSSLDSRISDTERFKDADPFLVRCRSCQGQLPFMPIHDRNSSILLGSGPTCLSCEKPIGTGSLQMQLETQIRDYVAKYYEAWIVCDDPTCGHRTRMMGVFGRRCLRQGCRGTVTFEYSESQLYNQLRYFSSLFDADKATKAATGTADLETVSTLINFNADFLRSMSDCVDKYLDQCGRRWIELSTIFSFMKM